MSQLRREVAGRGHCGRRTEATPLRSPFTPRLLAPGPSLFGGLSPECQPTCSDCAFLSMQKRLVRDASTVAAEQYGIMGVVPVLGEGTSQVCSPGWGSGRGAVAEAHEHRWADTDEGLAKTEPCSSWHGAVGACWWKGAPSVPVAPWPCPFISDARPRETGLRPGVAPQGAGGAQWPLGSMGWQDLGGRPLGAGGRCRRENVHLPVVPDHGLTRVRVRQARVRTHCKARPATRDCRERPVFSV